MEAISNHAHETIEATASGDEDDDVRNAALDAHRLHAGGWR